MQPAERVLIVDYGSQFTQLIARRVRELHVYCEIVPPWVDTERARAFAPAALILAGGPASVTQPGSPRINEQILDLGVPVLGICYGQQVLVQHLGGRVEPASEREYGRAELVLDPSGDPLLEGVPARSTVWMSHGDRVVQLPPGFRAIATSESSPFAAIRNQPGTIYGLTFHPEVAHSQFGGRMLGNFLTRVAGLHGTWSMDEFIEAQLAALRARVGSGRVICGVSGGVDSTVVAVLLHRALGEQVHCFF